MSSAVRRDSLFALLGAVSLLSGVLLADLVVDDGTVSLPEAAVSYAAPSGVGETAGDPGALVAPVEIAVPDALFPGAAIVYPTFYDSAGEPHLDIPDGTDPASGGDPDGAGAPDAGEQQSDSEPPDGQTAQADSGGTGGSTAALSPPGTATATIVRFLDLCADTSAPACPAGVGAVVLFTGSPAPPPPLQIEILADATAALYPGLRCDPGWPTEEVIPVALLSNRPLSLANVTLQLRSTSSVTSITSVTALHEVNNLKSDPAEHALYEQRVKAGQATAATIGSGFHTCLQLRFDMPGNTTPFNRQTEFDKNSQFEIDVVGSHGNDRATKTAKFSNQYTAAKRPPVRVKALDGNRASVWVPQKVDDTTLVWVESGGPGCKTFPGSDGSAQLNTATAVQQAIPPSAINDPNYPWDRTFDHYTVWDLELRASSQYTLCVQWTKEQRIEVWYVETPDGLAISLTSGYRHWRDNQYRGPARINVLGLPGCWMLDENVFLEFSCSSVGTRIAADIEFRALLPGDNEPYGVITRSRSHLAAQCTTTGGQGRYPCSFRLNWRSRQTLCGGSAMFPPTSCGDLLLEYEIILKVERLTTNHRPNPLDWGIQLVSTFTGPSP